MIKRRYLYLFIFVLTIIAVLELLQLSKVIYYFPSTDLSSHIANIYFINNYGFHKIIPNWYNGYISFLVYPPGLFFLSIPFYKIINNPQIVLYALLILSLLIGFVGTYFLGKILKLNSIHKLFLFLFFYFNPISITSFYIIGRLPEMLGWSFSFFYIYLIYKYKNKYLDAKFFTIIPIMAITILAHPSIFILSSSFLLGLFLIKSNKERMFIIISLLISLLLTSFWLIPAFNEGITYEKYQPFFNISLPTERILSFLTTIIFTGLLFYNLRKNKKEILFYSPVILISFLYITKLAGYLPILVNVHPRSIALFLILASLIIFLTSNYDKKLIKNSLIITLQIMPIIFLIIFFYKNVDNYPLYNSQHQEAISLLGDVKDKFIITGKSNMDIRTKDTYSYAAVKYNLSTPFGWDLITVSYRDYSKNLTEAFNNGDCNKINNITNELRGKEIISGYESCDLLKKCGFEKVKSTNNYCLYKK